MKATFSSERGLTIIETAIASTLLLIVMVGLLSMVAVATMYTENHGHLEARTTEYAQDKMEQLLALAYTDDASDTSVFPATAAGGSGLAVGGSIDTNAPVNLYVDWLAANGDPLGGGAAPPSKWFYQRVWQIAQVSGNVKQITVVATVRESIGTEMKPKSTVTVLKSSHF